MSRVSVRLRVVLASTLVMTLVLLALAGFVRSRVAAGLDGSLDRTLDARIADVAQPLTAGRTPAEATPGGAADDDAVVVQVLDRDGRVLAGSPGLRGPLLPASRAGEARDDDVTVDRATVAVREAGDSEDDRFAARVRAAPADEDRPELGIVVAAVALGDRDEALGALDTALLVGLPVAVLLSAGLGWGLASAALRPVEAMRRRAEGISGPSDERLPVPGSRDEIARLGRTLNALLDRQAESFRRERAFVADASHELRTPLTILRTELDLAARGERPPGELRAALASASDEARRLERLTASLLALARADAPQQSPAGPVAVTALLEAVRDRYAGALAAAGRTLSVAPPLPGTPGEARGHRDALERAVGGLVENALHHGAGDVTLRAAPAEGGLVGLHVLDRGPGVPEALAGRAFDRFVTGAGEDRERRGTGLGLAIVAAVAAAHGGRAGLEARPGGGTDAWLAVSSNSHPAPPSVGPSPAPRPRNDAP